MFFFSEIEGLVLILFEADSTMVSVRSMLAVAYICTEKNISICNLHVYTYKYMYMYIYIHIIYIYIYMYM